LYVCISADTKGVVKLRVGTTDACLLPAFRTGMSPLVKEHSTEVEQILAASGVDVQRHVARPFDATAKYRQHTEQARNVTT
jgi:hypothetical protein